MFNPVPPQNGYQNGYSVMVISIPNTNVMPQPPPVNVVPTFTQHNQVNILNNAVQITPAAPSFQPSATIMLPPPPPMGSMIPNPIPPTPYYSSSGNNLVTHPKQVTNTGNAFAPLPPTVVKPNNNNNGVLFPVSEAPPQVAFNFDDLPPKTEFKKVVDNVALGKYSCPPAPVLPQIENKSGRKKKCKSSLDARFQCPICEKFFTRKSNLKQHLKIHSNTYDFKCPVCQRGFKQKHSMVDHIRIHTGERPFKCQYCSKAFKVKHNLTTHTRLHTGERPYLCSLCDKRFVSKSSLNAHTRSRHPKPKQEN